MEVIVRGNIVQFSTIFLDAAGAPTAPVSASVTVRPVADGADPGIELVMTESSGVWSTTWDTTDVSPGIVFWSVKAVSPHAAQDGYFQLEANWANV